MIRFAPEVSIVCAESGERLDGDTRANIPTIVIAVIDILVTKNRTFWKQALVAHGSSNDAAGVRKALEAIK